MKLLWQFDLEPGRKRAAAKRRAIGAAIDRDVQGAIAGGVPADAKALSAHLGISIWAVYRSLKRQASRAPKPQPDHSPK